MSGWLSLVIEAATELVLRTGWLLVLAILAGSRVVLRRGLGNFLVTSWLGLGVGVWFELQQMESAN